MASGPHDNAHVFDLEGTGVASFHVGDGVQFIQTDSSGRIWVGYFDEGVFGRGEFSPGGLDCFDSEGHCLFQFNEVAESWQLPCIDECYALNVVADGNVWAYCYSSYSVVHLKDFEAVGVWRDLPVELATAMAVSGDKVLFARTDDAPHQNLAVWVKGSSTIEEVEVLDERGQPLEWIYSTGRDNKLYLQTQMGQVYVVDAAHVEDP